MTSRDFLNFETDFIESLRCIPMIVRMKLDTCGVKLKLVHWNQFSVAEKQSLVSISCSTLQEIEEYRSFVQKLVVTQTGKPAGTLTINPNPDWLNQNQIPLSLQTKLSDFNQQISLQAWAGLSNLQRFALIKLSRPSHENRNFLPALKEFKLVD